MESDSYYEKISLLYQSFFGIDNDISVACCGSNISAYQIQLLLDCDVKEIIIAFDRQFQMIGDDEFKHLTNNLTKINERYKNYVDISIIFDKKIPAICTKPYGDRIILSAGGKQSSYGFFAREHTFICV